MRITSDLLRANEACKDQVELFESLFPEGTEITEDLCVKHASQFDWGWTSRNLLNKKQRESYDLATASARKAYRRAVALAGEAYDLAVATAREAYRRATAPAGKAFDLAIVLAEEAYDLATASAFARAFLNQI